MPGVLQQQDKDTTTIAVKALMWHTDDCKKFFYTARLIAALAQRILNQCESSLKAALRRVVSGSGLDYCFEYLGQESLRQIHAVIQEKP